MLLDLSPWSFDTVIDNCYKQWMMNSDAVIVFLNSVRLNFVCFLYNFIMSRCVCYVCIT